MPGLSKHYPYTGLYNQTKPPILFLDAENDAMMSQPELKMLQIHSAADKEHTRTHKKNP